MTRSNRTKFIVVATLSTAFSMIPPPSNAQSTNPGLDDIFQLRVGPFFPNLDTQVSVAGANFDLDQVFDNSKTTASAYAQWRITPKIHLNVGYRQISRDESITSSTVLSVGGITLLPAGTALNADYETSSLPIILKYAFVKNPRTEFGAGIGAIITKIKTRIDIMAPGASTITPVNQDVTEPLPAIGLFWYQALSPKWMIRGQASYVPFEIGNIDATFVEASLGIEWRVAKNVGLGAAYLYNQADGNITSAGITTAFDYQSDGPFAYLMFGGGTR